MNINNLIQFFKFSIVGLSNTAIGLFVYYFLLWLGFHFLFANIVSWIISVYNAFYWNKRYVFKSNGKWVTLLVKTYFSYGFSLLINTFLLYITVKYIQINELVAPIIVLIFTIPLNFIMNKFWAFK